MKKIAIVCLLALASTGVAFADGNTALTTTAMNNYQAQSGIYVNGQLGFTVAEMPSGFSDLGFVFGPSFGYDFALTPTWLVGSEIGWLYLGSSSDSGTTITNSGTQLLFTSTYLLNNFNLPRFNVFGKVGFMEESTDESTSLGSGAQSGVVAALAFGGGYMVTPNINITAQYEAVFGDNYDTTTPPSNPMAQNMFTVGVTYKIPLGENLYDMNTNMASTSTTK